MRETLGKGHSERINTLVCDIVDHSWAASGLVGSHARPRISMSIEMAAAANALRDFMFEKVYLWDGARREAARASRVVYFLFGYYVAHPEEITSDFARLEDAPERRAADYIAGMTDLFAERAAAELGFRS